MMMAIAHGAHVKDGPRGRPPKSVAAKYTNPGKDAPETHGKNSGGAWTKEHHEKHSKKSKKKDLKKTFEEFYKTHDLSTKEHSGSGKAAAAIVINDDGHILFGKHKAGLAIPGGHMDPEDNGDFAICALRELKEEAGIVGRNPTKVWEGKDRSNEVKVYLIESWTGTPKHGDDLSSLKWIDPKDIDWKDIRDCCVSSVKAFIEQKLGKSLSGMIALEQLEKNIIRQKADAVFEVTHGDALRLIGTGAFRKIREAVKDMEDEEFRDVKFDTHTLSIRRHMSDVYSGRVSDGHKIVYQFTNKSLPEVTAALMSVFEWYLPEDEKELNLLDDVGDDVVSGGIQTLIDNYKKHNIGNIYEEMETIRQQIRNGVAVDIQQVEARIMGLFDKLEELMHNMADKHNDLAEMASKEFDEVELKLRDLQNKLDEINKMPSTIEAFSARKPNAKKIHDENFPFLPRPQIEIEPNGKMRITFAAEWSDMEKSDFLSDLKAKVIKRRS
jgi:8-oxo-dGTP pyrophosphatase MutT (NUDIX family)/Txe/YoeB family toxin of Txe-Axe toxin-antitoxin module